VTTDVRVVKVGGNLAEDPAWIASVAAALAATGAPTVLVHGGGREVSRVQRAMGVEPAWRDGLRVSPAGRERTRTRPRTWPLFVAWRGGRRPG
jgi:acetylglutamate kinase